MVTRKWGVPALKAALDEPGLYGGPSRMPLLPLEESRLQEIRKLIASLEEHRVRH